MDFYGSYIYTPPSYLTQLSHLDSPTTLSLVICCPHLKPIHWGRRERKKSPTLSLSLSLSLCLSVSDRIICWRYLFIMRILSWVKDKINGKPEKKRADEGHLGSSSSNGLLAIGTFGNSAFTGDSQRYASSETSRFSGFTVDSQRYASSERSSSSQNLSNFTVEEVYKLQKELARQLARKSKSGSCDSDVGSGRKANLQLDKFLSCPSGLEIERGSCEKICENMENGEDGDISPNTRMVLIKARDILSSDKHKKITKKSFKFLLKKMFVCGGGFANVPGLKDPIPETRMEKLLKTIIQKKMYSQHSAPTTTKYLEKKPMDEEGIEDDRKETTDSGGRWVKTDSEYIVLEI